MYPLTIARIPVHMPHRWQVISVVVSCFPKTSPPASLPSPVRLSARPEAHDTLW